MLFVAGAAPVGTLGHERGAVVTERNKMLISAPPPYWAQKLLFSEQSTIDASGQWSPNPAGGREMLAIASFVAVPSLLAYGLLHPAPPRNSRRCSLADNAITLLGPC